MKILVISDIHSNIWALEAILNIEHDYDLICCAGDFVDYGTAPDKVINWAIKQKNAYFVQGNHDLLTVKEWYKGEYKTITSSCYKWVHHNCERLNESHIDFLKNLPRCMRFEADNITYTLQHQYDHQYGIIQSRYEFNHFWQHQIPIAADEQLYQKERCLIFGHTHRQGCYMLEDQMRWLNPGSISYRRPDDPDKTAHYAIITDGKLSLKRAVYNSTPLLNEAKRFYKEKNMLETELQDFFFFFGSAATTRDPLV